VRPMSEVRETGPADSGPVVESARTLFRPITEQLADRDQYRVASDRLLYQPTRQAHELSLLQEPVQHAFASKADRASRDEAHYREVYTTWVEIGSIAAGMLAAKLHLVGQGHAAVVFDSIVAMSSSPDSSGRAALIEIDSNTFKASGDLSLLIGDITELAKQIAATDPDDPLRERKLATLGRMITDIPGVKARLGRLGETRTIALKGKNSKHSK